MLLGTYLLLWEVNFNDETNTYKLGSLRRGREEEEEIR